MGYDKDVLATPRARPRAAREVTLTRGLVVEVLSDGFVGEVVGASADRVRLQDRRGRQREFVLSNGGFLVDDHPARLVLPTRTPTTPSVRTTASGSIAVDRGPRVARASRILVEGIHDAELVERVWGDDLRVEGIVVETMDGVDDLPHIVQRFRPGPTRRLGILLDHLVAGSKEQRLAALIDDPHVLITGHDFVDVWAAVRPTAAGIPAWPDVPRGQPWKEGVIAALGVDLPPPVFFRQLLARVDTIRDLDHSLTRAVETLIDFVASEA